MADRESISRMKMAMVGGSWLMMDAMEYEPLLRAHCNQNALGKEGSFVVLEIENGGGRSALFFFLLFNALSLGVSTRDLIVIQKYWM